MLELENSTAEGAGHAGCRVEWEGHFTIYYKFHCSFLHIVIAVVTITVTIIIANNFID